MKGLFNGILTLVVSAIAGAILAPFGVKVAGMNTAISLAPLVFIGIGLFVGTAVFVFCVFISLRLSTGFIIAIILSFLAGLAGSPLMEYHYR